jgi:hypothetical protein
MRDPAVLALYVVRVTAEEFASIRAGVPIVRPYWPPGRCRGAVVGLQVGGDVIGEALLAGVTSTRGGATWAFGVVTPYLRTLPHVFGRGMSSPMPEAPLGTLTPARNWDDDFS